MPLDTSAPPPHGSPEGRRRLGGAFLIDTDRVAADPNQPRRQFDTAAQRELNASVERLGILQPITVRFIAADNNYRIITGERRYLAAKNARLNEIPCWVQTPKDEDVLLHQIVENWQRADMHPYDLADALARLRDANGFTQKQLAEHTGKSEGEISKLLAILDLDPAVQKIAREDESGRITKRHLYAVTRLDIPEQKPLIEKALQRGMTAVELENLVEQRHSKEGQPKKRGAPVKQIRFPVSSATVTVTFRKKHVATEEVVKALDEARAQVGEPYRKTA